jgi:hypothetical protein
VLLYILLALALVLLLLIGLAVYGRLVVNNQRKSLAALRQHGVAFLCRPRLGMQHLAGYILSVDQEAVSLWKVGLRRPVRKSDFPSLGATVTPAPVKINVARTSTGVSLVSAAGQRIDVVIYPDPTMSYSTPTDGALLELVCDEIRKSLGRVTPGDR